MKSVIVFQNELELQEQKKKMNEREGSEDSNVGFKPEEESQTMMFIFSIRSGFSVSMGFEGCGMSFDKSVCVG